MSLKNGNEKPEKMSAAVSTTIPSSEPGFQLKVTSASSRTLYLSPTVSSKLLPSAVDKEDTPEDRRDFLKSLKSGDVVVAGKFVGAIRYLGPLSDSGAKILYAGIELCENKGSMDGSMHVEVDESGKERIVSASTAAELSRQSSTLKRVKKIRYFRCEKEGNFGIMIPANSITKRIEAWTLVKKVNTLHKVNRELGHICQELQAKQHDTDVREKVFRDLFAMVASRESSLATAEGSLSVARNSYHRSSTGSAPPLETTMFLTPKTVSGKPTLWNSQSDAPTVLITPDSDRPMLLDERSSGSHLSESSRKAVIQSRASQSSRMPITPLAPSADMTGPDSGSESDSPDQSGKPIMKRKNTSESNAVKKGVTPEDESSETHVISVDDFPADARLKPTRSLDGNPPDMRSLAGHMQDLESDAPESPGLGSTDASLRFRRSTSVGSLGSADDRQQRRDHERMIESGGLISHEADERIQRIELSEESTSFTGHQTEHFVSASLFTHPTPLTEVKSFDPSGLTVIDGDPPALAVTSASTSAVSTPATTPALGSVDESLSPYPKLQASDSMALSTIADGLHQTSLSMVVRRGTLCDSKGNALIPSPSDKGSLHGRMNLSMAVEAGGSHPIEEIVEGISAIAESETESDSEFNGSKMMRPLSKIQTVNIAQDFDDDSDTDAENESSADDEAVPTPAPDSPRSSKEKKHMRPDLDAIKHRKSNPIPPVATPISSAAGGSTSPADEDDLLDHPPKRRKTSSDDEKLATDSVEEEEEKAGSYHGPGKTTFIVETGPIMSEGRRTSIKFLRTRSTSSHMMESSSPTNVLGVKKRAFTDDGDSSRLFTDMDDKDDEDGDDRPTSDAGVEEEEEDLESKTDTRRVEIIEGSPQTVTRRTRSGTSAPSVGYTSGQKPRKRRPRHQKSVSVFVGASAIQVLDGGNLTLDNLRQYNKTKSVEQIMRMHKQRRSSSRTSIPGLRDLRRLADELDKEGSDIGMDAAGLPDRRPSVHSRETDEKQAVPPEEDALLNVVDIVDQETGSVVAVPVDEIDDGTRDRVEDDLLAEVGDEDPPLSLDESKMEKTQVVTL